MEFLKDVGLYRLWWSLITRKGECDPKHLIIIITVFHFFFLFFFYYRIRICKKKIYFLFGKRKLVWNNKRNITVVFSSRDWEKFCVNKHCLRDISTFGNFLFKVFQLLEIFCLKFPNFWKFSAQRFSTFGNFLPKVFQLLEILCLKSSNFWKFSAQSLPTFGNFLLKDFQLLEIFCPKFSNFWKFSA